jgi:hypothetical protein
MRPFESTVQNCIVALGVALGSAAHAGEPSAQVTEAVILERVRTDLAARHGIPYKDIRTVAVNSVIWRDTSLGCGKPTESYAQIDVEGWRISLEYNAQRFDYRARKDGGFILCNSGLPQPR